MGKKLPAITVPGGVLTGHFAHRDPLETCLGWRVRMGLEEGLVAEEDLTTKLASSTGQQHEVEVLEELQQATPDLRQIPNDDKYEQIRLTCEAMAEGVPIIAGGMLKMGERIGALAEGIRERFALHATPTLWGEPDLLRKVDAPGCGGRFGDWYYEVGDVKSARKSKLTARLQVSYYSWILEDHQGILPATGYVLPRPLDPTSDSVTDWQAFKIAEVLPVAELFVREEYWRIVLADPADLVSTSGYSTPYAAAWAEREGLAAESVADRDLAFLPGIRLPSRRKLRSAGIATIGALVVMPDGELTSCAGPGVTAVGLAKHRVQAQVAVEGRPRWRGDDATDLRTLIKTLTDHADRPTDGIDPLDPDAAVVHFDMESDPFAGLEYLFGYRVEDAAGQAVAEPIFIWAPTANAEGEQAAFESFLDQMDELRQQYGTLIVIHYASYEPAHMRALADRYPGTDNMDRVEQLCSEMVDCYRVITAALWMPFDSYSIKDIAPGIESLSSPGGPGKGHSWLKIPTIDAVSAKLVEIGWSAADVAAAEAELRRAQEELGLEDESELLASSAAMSIVWHDRWRRSGEPVWKQLIELYNGDDLEATRAVWAYLKGLAANETAGIDAAEEVAP